jgi:hypothetical protein
MPLSIAISRIRVRCGAGASEEKLQSCALVLWFRKPVMIIRAALLLTLALTPLRAAVAQIQEPKPKLASAATPLLRPDDYLRSHPAPDFWTLLAFYVPQATDAACSVASITMALNAARGLPPSATDPIITQQRLLERVADARWTEATVQGGPGVTWAELEGYVAEGLRAYQVPATLQVWRPSDGSAATLEQLRELLAENEQSSADVIVGVFDQGVLTGDVNIGHVSPIAAYDQRNKRVLVMDVDREWYVPYWVSDELLLEAMLKPGSHDPERGGLLRVRKIEPQVN